MDRQAIEVLRRLNQEDLEAVYKRVFESNDGAVILEDLKSKFWEYFPVQGDHQAGQQAVTIYIKNMINPLPKDASEHGE